MGRRQKSPRPTRQGLRRRSAATQGRESRERRDTSSRSSSVISSPGPVRILQACGPHLARDPRFGVDGGRANTMVLIEEAADGGRARRNVLTVTMRNK
jgi:hypothetical protein